MGIARPGCWRAWVSALGCAAALGQIGCGPSSEVGSISIGESKAIAEAKGIGPGPKAQPQKKRPGGRPQLAPPEKAATR